MKRTPPLRETPRRVESIAEEVDEILPYQYPEGDEEFEEELERELKKDPQLKASGSYIKAMRAFRNACPSIKNIDPKLLSIYIIHPKPDGRLNVAPTRAFGTKNAVPDITYLLHEGTEAAAETYEKKAGFPVHKGEAEHHRLSKPVDLVVVMDDTVRPTNRLLETIEPGRWILWPLKTANALRALGYQCRGIVQHEGAYPHVNKEVSGFWRELEVENDEDLRSASGKSEEGAVTYEEAKEVVRKVYGTEKNVVERYKELIRKAGEQNPTLVEKGEANLTYTFERNGKTNELLINTILPLKEREYDERDLAIFKKKG